MLTHCIVLKCLHLNTECNLSIDPTLLPEYILSIDCTLSPDYTLQVDCTLQIQSMLTTE